MVLVTGIKRSSRKRKGKYRESYSSVLQFYVKHVEIKNVRYVGAVSNMGLLCSQDKQRGNCIDAVRNSHVSHASREVVVSFFHVLDFYSFVVTTNTYGQSEFLSK